MLGGIGRLPKRLPYLRVSQIGHLDEDAYIQQLGDDGGWGHLYENNMVKANMIEWVEQCEATLDLVCFDHALENVLDGDALALACQVVRDGEDGTEIVGRVAPLKTRE